MSFEFYNTSLPTGYVEEMEYRAGVEADITAINGEINSLNGSITALEEITGSVDLNELDTVDKTGLINAINENVANIATNAANIGNAVTSISNLNNAMKYEQNVLSLEQNSWGYRGVCVRNWRNGATEGSQYYFDADYYKNAISTAITTLGIDSVQIIPNTYQQTSTSTNVEYRTPISVNETRNLINYCKGLGLKVTLCPHVESDDSAWRGGFVPSVPADWFTSYKVMIEKWADLAEETKCDIFFVGSEYKTLTTNTYRSNWETIISGVRAKYKGILAYGANCSNASVDEYSTLCFWDLLDVVGLDVYLYPTDVTTTPNADYDQLMHSNKDKQNLLYAVNRLAKIYNKPIIFAEYGIESTNDTYKANHLESYLRNYGNFEWNRGMFLWAIDPLDITNNWYTNGTTSQAAVKKYYSQKTKANKITYPDIYTTTMSSDANTYWTKIATVKLVNTSMVEGCINIAREQVTTFDRPTLSDLYFRVDAVSMSGTVNVVLKLGQNAFIHSSNISYVKIQDDTTYKIVDIYIKVVQDVQYSLSLKSISKNKLITLYDKQTLLSNLPAGTSGEPTNNIMLTGYITGTTASGLISETIALHFPMPSSANDINITYAGASITSLTGGNTYDINLNTEIVDAQHIKVVGKHLYDTTNRDYTIKWLVIGY